MEGTLAVIGTTAATTATTNNNNDNVQLYSLTKGWVEVVDSSKQTLVESSFTQDENGSVLQFTQLLNDGVYAPTINGNGRNMFIWSIGRNNNIQNGHSLTGDYHGSIVLDLTPCVDDGTDEGGNGGFVVTTKNDRQLFALHGKLAIAAFAALMPLAVIIALLRKQLTHTILCNKQAWIVIHTALNTIAYLITVGVFALSIVAMRQSGGEHFHNAHSIVGLIVFILVTVQVVLAFVRPSAPVGSLDN